jgi:hypothetical protein
MRILLAAVLCPLLSGCVVGSIANAAVDIAALPVKVASAGIDAATASRSEADEKRGRALRRQDEERGRLFREAQERCRKGTPVPTDDCTGVVPR